MKKAERTKQYIIEKTAVLFNKKGFAGTSLNDITSATELTKGAIYGNFKNKDEVAVQVFKFNVNKIINTFSTEIESAATCYDKLLAYPKVYRRIYREEFNNGGCPILNTLTDTDDTHPVLHKLAVATVQKWKHTIMEIIKQGKQADEFKENVQEERIAEIMISLFEGGGILAKTSGDENFIMSSLEHIEKLLASIKK
jgi:TetR/AcrR family transcriptional repressor of nem operon